MIDVPLKSIWDMFFDIMSNATLVRGQNWFVFQAIDATSKPDDATVRPLSRDRQATICSAHTGEKRHDHARLEHDAEKCEAVFGQHHALNYSNRSRL
jgi:hypothetical protein